MKATLEYNLPDDELNFYVAVNSLSWFSTVSDLDTWLRNKIKYEGKDWQEIRDYLHELLDEKDISL